MPFQEIFLSPHVLALFGLCIGSFLNVVIHRLPLMLERGWKMESADLLGVAHEETPCQFKPGNRRKVDVEYADIRLPFAEHAFATLRVGGFQYVDLGVVREQGTAPRSNDAMIVNDQNAHWHWSRTLALLPLPHRIRQNTGADFGAIHAVDGHATRAMLLYASIR